MGVCWVDAWSKILEGEPLPLAADILGTCEEAHNRGLVLLLGEREGVFSGEMQLCRRVEVSGLLWPVPVAFDLETARAVLEALALDEEAGEGVSPLSRRL